MNKQIRERIMDERRHYGARARPIINRIVYKIHENERTAYAKINQMASTHSALCL